MSKFKEGCFVDCMNIPIQYFPPKNDEEGYFVNYMPRKMLCREVLLSEIDDISISDFLEQAALRLEALAKRMRDCEVNPDRYVYFAE